MNVTRDQIYNTLSNALTDYEDNSFQNEESLYNMLVEIQNRWEDTITCIDDDQLNTAIEQKISNFLTDKKEKELIERWRSRRNEKV